ncbi:hypothetical protein FQA39_LY13187 [Lamprigera yunnana]|nr:hypothetical protein FQA39_LY13187 [Lamprigera yunnana]
MFLRRLNFRNCLIKDFNMIVKTPLDTLKLKMDYAETLILQMKNELETIYTTYVNLKCHELVEQNKKLLAEVEGTKKHLIALEIQNGIKQVPLNLMNQSRNIHSSTQDNKKIESEEKGEEQKSAKTVDKKKAAEPKQKKAVEEKSEVIDIGRLDLRVGKIEHVKKHPDADTLYVLKINCGEDKPRTVCSGLVKFIPIEELEDKEVLLLCNLKSAKMRGVTSEAMIMCASRPDGIELIIPPPGCKPGEPVQCPGYTRNPDLIMNPKKKIFETVVPDLSTNESLQACYKDVPFEVTGKGDFKAKSLKNCPIK